MSATQDALDQPAGDAPVAPHGGVAATVHSRIIALFVVSGAAALIYNLISEYRHGLRFGPAILQALQPPPPPKMFAEGL
jgi:hypothetical protein